MPGIENKIEFANGFKLQPSDATAIANMQELSTDISMINYTGNPNGAVSANPSSLCHDYATGNIYVKTSGTGNTGWELISSSNLNVTTPGAYPYTTVASDGLILVDSSVARTIIPRASPGTGESVIIKDNGGQAATNNITVTPSGKNIDGAASFVINTNYGSITIVYNGTQWNVV